MNDYANPSDPMKFWYDSITEIETALIGGVILHPEAVGSVLQTGLETEHFGDLGCAALWTRIAGIISRGGTIDHRTVLQGGAGLVVGEGASPGAFLAKIMAEAARAGSLAEYAGLVKSAWVVRRFLDAADKARDEIAGADGIALARQLIETVDALRDSAIERSGSTRGSLGEIAAKVGANAQEMLQGKRERPPSTGLTDLDKHLPMGGLAPGSLIILAGRTGQGKAQPLTASIRTPHGWSQMGDLRIGDEVCSRSGERSVVTGVFPQGAKQVFRVIMSDGRSTRVCGDHLWEVHCAKWAEPRVISTDQIASYLQKPSYRRRLTIPMHSGEVGRPCDLPLDPWLLGALIGNGCFRNGAITFSSSDPETIGRVRASLPSGHELLFIDRYDYRIKGGNGGMALARALSELGLRERLSCEKHIPRQYLDSDRFCRMELLRGLMDTDGWVEQDGAALYQTSSPVLGRDVVELARSLGFWARIRVRQSFITEADGARSRKLDAYTIAITGPHIREIVSLPRKAERLANRSWNRALTITSIEPDGEEECQCISVSASDSLYLTDDYIVTHNTLVASALASKMATKGKGAAYFSLEVPADEIAARTICERIGARGPVYGDVLAGRMTDDDLEKFIWASREAEKLPLHIDDAPAMTIQDIALATKKQAVKFDRAGTPLALVLIDHAQIVKGSSRYQGNRVGELGEIANGAKIMAKQLGCAVVLCCQLNRGVESRDDKRPMLSDLRASGELEEAADAVLMLYREAYYLERSQAFRNGDVAAVEMMGAVRNQIEIGIEKSRQGSTGRATLWCDPGRSILADQARYGS